MLDFSYSLGGFLVAIGVLVAFHEFGHYWVARRCGVKVLRFSLGFGKVLWRKVDKEGVEWTLSAIPLGGYVKMLDEREGEVPAALRALAFNNASVWRRIAIVAAGPLFNFALAIAFYWLIHMIGIPGEKPILATPPANTVAARAGLQQGDLVLSLDGEAVATMGMLHTRLVERSLDRGSVPVQVRGQDGVERGASLDLSAVRVDPEFLFQDLGLQLYLPPYPPKLKEVQPGSAAEAAGIKPGDLVVAVNQEPMPTWQVFSSWLRAHPGAVIDITVEREGGTQTLHAIVGSHTEGDTTVGLLGVGVDFPEHIRQDSRAVVRLGPVEALPAAVDYTWRMSVLMVKMLGRMITGEVSVKNVSGPIQIAEVAGITAQIGLVTFLGFMASVSVSLGVLNLMPVPLLDGGHLLYYVVEAVKGSPLSERVQEMGQRLGLTVLVMLMGLAFFNDISRLLT